MSYVLELEVPVASWEAADRLASMTAPDEFLALVPNRRRYWSLRRRPGVHFDFRQADDVLDDQADLNEDRLLLSPRREALARTILLLARELAGEWSIRSYWIGDKLRDEQQVSGEQLADLASRSALDRHVRYRVVSS